MIYFPCQPKDPLNFTSVTLLPNALCRLDLGLENPYFPLDDLMHFQSLSLALKEWTEKVYVNLEKPQGCLLYSGSADFAASFLWSEKCLQNFQEWKEQNPHTHMMPLLHQQRLFCADSFVYYFQILSHSLPDDLPVFLWLDAEGLGSPAMQHHIVSSERFSNFQIAVNNLKGFNGPNWEGVSPKSSQALSIPEDKSCTIEVLQQCDQILQEHVDMRVIHEQFLTDEWEGVDLFYALKKATTESGLRKLKGFLATGGEVVWK